MHKTTDRNMEALTAVCETCGPVELKWWTDKYGCPNKRLASGTRQRVRHSAERPNKKSLKHEWSWAAGIFEGEGSISTSNTSYLQIVVNMTDKDVLEKLQGVIGGSLNGPHSRADRPQHKPRYVLSVGRREDIDYIITRIWPFLLSRRRGQIRAKYKEVGREWVHVS